MDKQIRFAPLIRVSTERQEKQGESLKTQRKQLEGAIASLNGVIYRWYAGQEHATPDQERRILEGLMRDALDKRFDAIMVADLSRWSRDNGKSKEYTKILKDKGIRFFVGLREIDLFDPSQAFILGMSVEVAEFFATGQAYSSIQNRINRAKEGFLSSSGRFPYGRIFNKQTKEWAIDEEKQKKVEEAARLYLDEDIPFKALGKRFGINHAYLWEVLTKRCGDTWEQRFRDERFNIDEVVPMKIPRLLPEKTIQRIKEKCEARKVWDKRSPRKNQYLFAHIVYDQESGYTLTGLTNRQGQQHYRPFEKIKKRYMVNAKILETAVLEAFFEALSFNDVFRRAVFNGSPLNEVAEELVRRKRDYEEELRKLERKFANVANVITEFDSEDMSGFLPTLRDKIRPLEERRSNLKFAVQSIDNQLRALPTYQEIEDERDWMSRSLEQFWKANQYSHTSGGMRLYQLPFDDKLKLVRLVFGGKDPDGKRYGIYITPLGGNPKSYSFTAYGRLGNINGGWTAGEPESCWSDGGMDIWYGDIVPNPDHLPPESKAMVLSDMARAVREADSVFFKEYQQDHAAMDDYKARMLCKGGPDQGCLRAGQTAGHGGRPGAGEHNEPRGPRKGHPERHRGEDEGAFQARPSQYEEQGHRHIDDLHRHVEREPRAPQGGIQGRPGPQRFLHHPCAQPPFGRPRAV
jgi:DNA invertase Pin-like site-specific DNA recombinase